MSIILKIYVFKTLVLRWLAAVVGVVIVFIESLPYILKRSKKAHRYRLSFNLEPYPLLLIKTPLRMFLVFLGENRRVKWNQTALSYQAPQNCFESSSYVFIYR